MRSTRKADAASDPSPNRWYAAAAKINLALHVTGRRSDDYHTLDTLVAFAEVGDRVGVRPQSDLTFEITGPFADSIDAKDNSVIAAARALQAATGCEQGAALTLEKNLPVAAGIGGGSADAAATLRALTEMWDIALPRETLDALALRLGADVPMCFHGEAARVRGIGEQIEPIALPAIPFVLVNCGTPVSTPAVFAALQDHDNAPIALPAVLCDVDDWFSLLRSLRNDLTAPAIAAAPSIATSLEALAANDGCRLARMSGSGATCFGLFYSHETARQAARQIEHSQPDWWVASSRTLPGPERR